MTLPVVWLPEAENELMDAFGRYEGIRPELGQRFANAVIETVEAISEEPLRFALVDKEGVGLVCGDSLIACSSLSRIPGL